MPFDLQKFKSKKPTKESIEVPDCGTVYVQSLTLADRMAYQQAVAEHRSDPGKCLLLLMAAAVRDEAGKKVFGPADLEELESADGALVERLAIAAFRLNNPDADAAQKK